MKDTQKNTKTIIYTDGACTDNPGPGGYAAVILTENERIEISKGFKRTTNNRMELLSVISALEELKTKSKVDLYSDSKYVVDAINRNWLNNWIKNNWIKSDKRRVMNMDLWKQLIPLIKKHDVNFIWLRGHNNVNENERCDQLAKEAAKNPQFEDI
ncbi:MAG: ribonuclease HI [Defluviitaleaceae bacterium]|nr:ribonuclease HI [Defluviitaleaceae bacterium]